MTYLCLTFSGKTERWRIDSVLGGEGNVCDKGVKKFPWEGKQLELWEAVQGVQYG